MEEFIDDVKVVINALGYKVLEPLIQKGLLGRMKKNCSISLQDQPMLLENYTRRLCGATRS